MRQSLSRINLLAQSAEQNRIEEFQLEGTLDDHLLQLPDHYRTNKKHIMKGIAQVPLLKALVGMGYQPPLQEACSSA